MSGTLLRNVVRTLRQKWMQLTAIGLIIVFSSMSYTMMFYGLSGIADPTTRYLEASNQEDFSVEMVGILTPEESAYPFVAGLSGRGVRTLREVRSAEPVTFSRLIDSRIDAVEEYYGDVALELRAFKLLDEERGGRTHTALVTTDAERVNLTWVEAGRKPVADDEVAVNRAYATKNALGIGDLLTLDGEPRRITGYVLLPDYTLAVFDNSLDFDTGLQAVVLMPDAAYRGLAAEEHLRLAGVHLGEGTLDVTYDPDALPFATQVAATATTMRSGAIYDELTQGRVTGLGLSLVIASIAVVIVTIMMGNLMNAERGQIGILKALGYTRVEIALPYFVSIVAVALVMLVAGYGVGTLLAEPLKAMYLDFYLLPSARIDQSPEVLLTAVGVPAAFFALTSGVVIYRMLGNPALDLLKPHAAESMNRLSRVVGRMLRRSSGRTKFTVLHALRSTGSFAVFFVGMLFSTLLITFAFAMDGLIDKMTVGYLDRVAYAYQAYADPTQRVPEPEPGQERFLTYPYARLGDRVVTLYGLAPDAALHRLYDEDGRDITAVLRTEAVVTGSLALKHDLAPGDRIRLTVDGQAHDVEVGGVSDEYSADQVYLDIERLSALVSDGRSTRLSSGIYSMTAPSEDSYSVVISRDGLIEQSRAMATYTAFMLNMMVVASAVIAASILFVLTSFSVERNYYSISLLKVLGYSRREVNGMILNSYVGFALLSYAASVPITFFALDALIDVFLEEYGVVFPLEMDAYDVVRGLVVLAAILLAGTWASRRKIERTPLQEVLKTYGE